MPRSTSEAIQDAFISENVPDSNLEPANLVDVVNRLAFCTGRIADAITPVAVPGEDATGGSISSLTEAVMGMTAGLVQIASAIRDLAEAVRDHDSDEPMADRLPED